MEDLTAEQLVEHLRKRFTNFEPEHSAIFIKHAIDGHAFMELNWGDLTEMNLPLGVKKNCQTLITQEELPPMSDPLKLVQKEVIPPAQRSIISYKNPRTSKIPVRSIEIPPEHIASWKQQGSGAYDDMTKYMKTISFPLNTRTACPFEGCDTICHNKGDFTDHINSVHIRHPAFPCKYCDKGKFTRKKLKEHMKR